MVAARSPAVSRERRKRARAKCHVCLSRGDPVRPICESGGALGAPRSHQKNKCWQWLGISGRARWGCVVIRTIFLARQKLAHNYSGQGRQII